MKNNKTLWAAIWLSLLLPSIQAYGQGDIVEMELSWQYLWLVPHQQINISFPEDQVVHHSLLQQGYSADLGLRLRPFKSKAAGFRISGQYANYSYDFNAIGASLPDNTHLEINRLLRKGALMAGVDLTPIQRGKWSVSLDTRGGLVFTPSQESRRFVTNSDPQNPDGGIITTQETLVTAADWGPIFRSGLDVGYQAGKYVGIFSKATYGIEPRPAARGVPNNHLQSVSFGGGIRIKLGKKDSPSPTGLSDLFEQYPANSAEHGISGATKTLDISVTDGNGNVMTFHLNEDASPDSLLMDGRIRSPEGDMQSFQLSIPKSSLEAIATTNFEGEDGACSQSFKTGWTGGTSGLSQLMPASFEDVQYRGQDSLMYALSGKCTNAQGEELDFYAQSDPVPVVAVVAVVVVAGGVAAYWGYNKKKKAKLRMKSCGEDLKTKCPDNLYYDELVDCWRCQRKTASR